MRIKHRSVLLALALAALLVPTLVAAGAPAGAVVRAAATSCDTTPVFFAVHGLNEGPDPTDPSKADSTLLKDLDYAQNNISGAVLYDPISYPSLKFNVLDDLKKKSLIKILTDGVQEGENSLQAELTSYTKGCKPSQDKIVLVGYSEGAWVINKWLSDRKYRSEWSMIKGALLYGDPCWIKGSDEGLARAYGAPGCMSASSYPAPVAGAAFPVPDWGWCAADDGVCGGGYSAKGDPTNRTTELLAALSCETKYCHHFDYWLGGASSSVLVQGAKYMVKWLGMPELA